MGKKRNEESYVEKLEKELREEKAKNRQLIKRLRKLDKAYNRSIKEAEQEARDELEKEFHGHVEKEEVEKCPSCGKGRLLEINLGARIIKKCSQCPYRKTEKA